MYKIVSRLKDFNVEALEKFVEESSTPVVTVFNNDPSNHPFVAKFFNSPNAKVRSYLSLFYSFNIGAEYLLLITLLQLHFIFIQPHHVVNKHYSKGSQSGFK